MMSRSWWKFRKMKLENNKDAQGGGIVVLGDIYEWNGYGSAGGRIYSPLFLSPCLGASHFQSAKYIVEEKDG